MYVLPLERSPVSYWSWFAAMLHPGYLFGSPVGCPSCTTGTQFPLALGPQTCPFSPLIKPCVLSRILSLSRDPLHCNKPGLELHTDPSLASFVSSLGKRALGVQVAHRGWLWMCHNTQPGIHCCWEQQVCALLPARFSQGLVAASQQLAQAWQQTWSEQLGHLGWE